MSAGEQAKEKAVVVVVSACCEGRDIEGPENGRPEVENGRGLGLDAPQGAVLVRVDPCPQPQTQHIHDNALPRQPGYAT